MKYNISIVVAILLSVFLMQACKQETEQVNFQYQYNYYPMNVGKYLVYDVDSIQININQNFRRDSVHFQFKEMYDSAFTDFLGRKSIRVYQYRRKDASENWRYVNTAFVSAEADRIEKVENNQRFIKLIFPLALRQNWYGNIHIAEQPETWYMFENGENFWKYKYLSLNTSETILNMTYDSVATVQQVNSSDSQISKYVSIEKYATNIGLIQKDQTVLLDDTDPDTSPIEQRAEKGFWLRMKLIEHN
jgi:hypothetical protein